MRPRAVIDDRLNIHPAFAIGEVSKVDFTAVSTAQTITSTLLCVLATGADCHIKMGGAASPNDFLLVQGTYFFTRAVIGEEVNVVSAGIDGTLYITNMV